MLTTVDAHTGTMSTEIEVAVKMPDVSEYTVEDVSVQLSRKHMREAAIDVRNGEFKVTATSHYLGWAELNKRQKRLDVAMGALKAPSLKVSAHGILGQTLDGDTYAVDGAVDDYSQKVVTTTAMAEGAIEGVAADYEVKRDEPFSYKFKYARFDLAYASPRDAKQLSGLHRKVDDGQVKVAGATGDDAPTMLLA